MGRFGSVFLRLSLISLIRGIWVDCFSKRTNILPLKWIKSLSGSPVQASERFITNFFSSVLLVATRPLRFLKTLHCPWQFLRSYKALQDIHYLVPLCAAAVSPVPPDHIAFSPRGREAAELEVSVCWLPHSFILKGLNLIFSCKTRMISVTSVIYLVIT